MAALLDQVRKYSHIPVAPGTQHETAQRRAFDVPVGLAAVAWLWWPRPGVSWYIAFNSKTALTVT